MGVRLAKGLEEETFRLHMLDSLEATPAADELLGSPHTPARLRRALDAAARPVPLDEVVSAIEGASGEVSGAGYRTVVLLLHLEALRWVP
jgi:hypothetical protein